jgi:hypothetical protein
VGNKTHLNPRLREFKFCREPKMIADSFSIDVYCSCLIQDRMESDAASGDVPSMKSSTQGLLRSRRWPDSPGHVIPRLVWAGLGPSLLVVLSILRLDAQGESLLYMNLGLVLLVALILVSRWASWLMGDCRDAFGGRVRRSGVVTYSLMLTAFAAALWSFVEFVTRQTSG